MVLPYRSMVCRYTMHFLIENELGYTNYKDGKYITEDEATHITEWIDGAWAIKEIEKAVLEL